METLASPLVPTILGTTIVGLLLPTLISAVALFFASFLAWMVLPHHKGDWAGLRDESGFMNTVRDMDVAPGQYMFPHCKDSEHMKSDEFKQAMERGPVGTLTVFPGAPDMPRNLVCTFLFFLVASYCIGYLARLALDPGVGFMMVFRFVGTAGVLTYAAGGILDAIWFKKKIAMDIVDGVAYGLITGLIFALLWPST